MTRFTWIPLLVLVLALAGCSSKGKAGAKCAKAADCARGYYCLDEACKAGPETACAYLARCIPAMEMDQVETLFGEDGPAFVQRLQERPVEDMCKNQLRILTMANRMIVLTRACGPHVTKGP
jgi:hypothetical protein